MLWGLGFRAECGALDWRVGGLVCIYGRRVPGQAQEFRAYSRSQKVGNPIASILKSHV